MRDRNDTGNQATIGGMRRGVLMESVSGTGCKYKTPRLIPPLCLPFRVVILNEMIPSLQGIIEMKDLPIIIQEAKNFLPEVIFNLRGISEMKDLPIVG